jgi:diamine N-acetyltransferase
VELREVGASNRAGCEALEVHPEQRRFVAPVAEYLAACEAGPWRPLAIEAGGEVVGFVMWAPDPGDGSRTIGGLVIDRAHQGRGLGRAAMGALVEELFAEPGCALLAVTYAPANERARRLYRDAGFEETGEILEDEVVATIPAGAWTGARGSDSTFVP